jgi:hypothetical protein
MSPSYSLAVAAMAAAQDQPFVPKQTGVEEARIRNFNVLDGTADGTASMVYFRRPVTVEFAAYVVDLFEQAHGADVYVAVCKLSFGSLMELHTLYRLAGRTIPVGIVTRVKQWHDMDPKYRSKVGSSKADSLVVADAVFADFVDHNHAVPLACTLATKTKAGMEAIDDLARTVFGMGLSQLMAPVYYLVKCKRDGVSGDAAAASLQANAATVQVGTPAATSTSQKRRRSSKALKAPPVLAQPLPPSPAPAATSPMASPPVLQVTPPSVASTALAGPGAAPMAPNLNAAVTSNSVPQVASGSVTGTTQPAMTDDFRLTLLKYATAHGLTFAEALKDLNA